MSIKIVSVGKGHESWVVDGIERYQKRLKKPYDIEWVFLPHSSRSDLEARQEESTRIIARVDDSAFVILLDEIGINLSSTEISVLLQEQVSRSKKIVIIIGGAYGVDDSVRQRADFVWSLSKLVFPHQLVRLLLTEQIYRSQEIAGGKPYHHV